jgi:hypothetical protein
MMLHPMVEDAPASLRRRTRLECADTRGCVYAASGRFAPG